MFLCTCLCVGVVYCNLYSVTLRGTAVSLYHRDDGGGCKLYYIIITWEASVYEQKSKGFDVKLREHPVDPLPLSLCFSLKVGVDQENQA